MPNYFSELSWKKGTLTSEIDFTHVQQAEIPRKFTISLGEKNAIQQILAARRVMPPSAIKRLSVHKETEVKIRIKSYH